MEVSMASLLETAVGYVLFLEKPLKNFTAAFSTLEIHSGEF